VPAVTEVLLILVALALVAACGAFVAAEFAFVTVDRARVEREAAEGDRRARGVLAGVRSLSTQLSGAQVGITVTNLLIGFLAEPSIADLIDGPLESAGVPDGAVTGIALVIALVLATGVTMVFGELVPKNLAIARPLETARAVQGFQRGFTAATGPAIRFLNGTANAILRRLGVEPQEELASARSPDELVSLVGRSADQGTLEATTAALLQRSLAFGDRRAVDVMTPRARMRALQVDSPLLDLMRCARETGFSRFPVIAGDNDEVLGVAHLKHAMAVPYERRAEAQVRDVMTAPVLVPATVELDALLETLRNGGLQMAVVVDEFGTVDGIVTLEDLVEEIVGEVHDEHDGRDDSVLPDGEGRWLLSGLLRPDEAGRAVGLDLPEEQEYETLGGLVALHLGRLPEVGDTVSFPARDDEQRRREVTITVTELDGLRVDHVRLEHRPVHDDEQHEEGDG
jgi:CBS domain containing-hemolysin-like protein